MINAHKESLCSCQAFYPTLGRDNCPYLSSYLSTLLYIIVPSQIHLTQGSCPEYEVAPLEHASRDHGSPVFTSGGGPKKSSGQLLIDAGPKRVREREAVIF
jgi:hypothetical protein